MFVLAAKCVTATPQATNATTPTNTADTSSSATKPGKERAIIMLPNGLVIHEKITLSVSVERATIRGVYPSSTRAAWSPSAAGESAGKSSPGESDALDSHEHPEKDDYFQVDSKGAVVELIWPKSDLVS